MCSTYGGVAEKICLPMANLTLPEIVKSFGKGDEHELETCYFNTLKNHEVVAEKFLFRVVFLWLRYCLDTDMMLLVFLISLSPASMLFLSIRKKNNNTHQLLTNSSRGRIRYDVCPHKGFLIAKGETKKKCNKKSWGSSSSSSEEVKWMKSPQ